MKKGIIEDPYTGQGDCRRPNEPYEESFSAFEQIEISTMKRLTYIEKVIRYYYDVKKVLFIENGNVIKLLFDNKKYKILTMWDVLEMIAKRTFED